MSLHLFEKFILIALDQKKGKFLIDSFSLNYALAGAILLELSDLSKITVKNKRIILSDKKFTNHQIIDACIKILNKSKKDKKPRYWVYKIGNKSSGFKKIILNDLHNKNILKIEIRNALGGLFKIKRYPIKSPKEINKIKDRIINVVVKNGKPDIEVVLLLSLMESCKLTRFLFSNKKEYRDAKKRIKEVIKNIEISEAVNQTLREIQAAIIIATTSTFVSTSSS